MVDEIVINKKSQDAAAADAGLAALVDLAAAADGAGQSEKAASKQQAAAPVREMTTKEEISALVSVLVQVGAPWFPSLRAIYTDQTVGALAAAVAPVCDKHGWNVGDWLNEELAAALVVIPLGAATYAGIRGDIEAHKRDRKPEPEKGASEQQ